jgi:hypothetical protein
LPPIKGADGYVIGDREQLYRVWIKDDIEAVLIADSKQIMSPETAREILSLIVEENIGLGIGREQRISHGLII